MINKFVALLFLFSVSLQAQHTVNVKMSNAKKVSWVILYKIEGTQQSYVGRADLKDGQFSIKLSKNEKPGVYRLLYQLKKQNYLDFIYNNEDISLAFNPENPAGSVVFSQSKENNIFKEYTEAIAKPQAKLDSLQLVYFRTDDKQKQLKIEQAYTKQLVAINHVQNQYQNLAKDMLAFHFIKASKRFNAQVPFKSAENYLAAIKGHFFDAIDFNNPILINSTLITERINDFVFYVNVSQNTNTQNNLFKRSLDQVFLKIDNSGLTKDLVYYFINRFANMDNSVITNFLLMNYYNALPYAEQNESFKNDILNKLKTAVNTKAPNITWQDFSGNHSLYKLSGAKYYLVLFWSSTCSHCLHEVPILYNDIKDIKGVKVVAVGLENGPNPWTAEMKKYPNFIHVFGENHWQNKFAKAYSIHATPTYIVLDANKNIIAKPYGEKDVKAFFDKHNIH